MNATHKGKVTDKRTGKSKWAHLRELKNFWVQGVYHWEKPRKKGGGYVEHCANPNLSLDMSTITPLTRDDLRRPYLDAATAAQAALDKWDREHELNE